VSDSNVIKLAQPGAFTDSLTEVLRSGARALLTQAIEAGFATSRCPSALKLIDCWLQCLGQGVDRGSQPGLDRPQLISGTP
jgi:hypothetical protein